MPQSLIAHRREPAELRRGSIAVVMGMRPEAIKLQGIVVALCSAALVVSTGQHYDRSLGGDVTDELGLPEPAVSLQVGGSSRGTQIGVATAVLDEAFGELSPSAVVV